MKDFLFLTKRWLLQISIFFLGILANRMIKVVPFKRIMGLLTTDNEGIVHKPSNYKEALLKIVAEETELIADQVPWRMKCFENALVMLVFARLLKVELQVDFGVKKEEASVSAHAWTSIVNRKLTGRQEFENYTSVLKRTYRPKKYRKGLSKRIVH